MRYYIVKVKFTNSKRVYKFKCEFFERYGDTILMNYNNKTYEIDFNKIDYYSRKEIIIDE